MTELIFKYYRVSYITNNYINIVRYFGYIDGLLTKAF